MAMISAGDHDGMMSDINVTPLVDVMLVLLTVFIITAPLLMHAVPVNLPRASTSLTLNEARSVRISVTADGSVYLDRDAVAPTGVEAALKRLGTPRGLTVEILADEAVPYGNVARVMAQVQRAGVSKFAFVMLPDRQDATPRAR